jgi:pyruvate carboxylase subunit B
VCYSLTERHLGGPIYNIEYFVNKAQTIQDMGADSICIKDMAGLAAPYDIYELVKALKAVLKIPVEFHTHYTSGMASMSCLKAAEAGVDIIDTALAPFALRTSQPAVEPIVVALEGTPRDTGLNLAHLFKLGQYIESIAPKYRNSLNTTKMSVIDTGVLVHQIPGGMTSNLMSQLKEAGALDRIDEVYEELPRTRKELGSPPLVTPSSQIIGIQAVQNVLMGRYKMISGQVKDYIYGLYGKPPAEIDPEVQKTALKGYERGEEPITCRAADILEPEMEKAKEATKDIARDDGDVLIYALYPTTGMRYLRWKYGLEEPPAETKPKTLEDVKREDELIAAAKAGRLVEKVEKPVPLKGPGMRAYNVFVRDEYYKVEVEPAGGTRAINSPAASAAPPKPAETVAAQETGEAPAVPPEGAVLAPMSGIIIRYEVAQGQAVKAGDTVVILEAMKMESVLPAPIDGIVKEIRLKPGDRVAKDDVIAVIG